MSTFPCLAILPPDGSEGEVTMTAEGAEASEEEEDVRDNVSVVQEDVSTNSIIEKARRAANLAKKPQQPEKNQLVLQQQGQAGYCQDS